MKALKIFVAVLLTSLCVTSCGSFANMSDQDAYDIGWGLGRAASYLF